MGQHVGSNRRKQILRDAEQNIKFEKEESNANSDDETISVRLEHTDLTCVEEGRIGLKGVNHYAPK